MFKIILLVDRLFRKIISGFMNENNSFLIVEYFFFI